jgi:hypothetical protein
VISLAGFLLTLVDLSDCDSLPWFPDGSEVTPGFEFGGFCINSLSRICRNIVATVARRILRDAAMVRWLWPALSMVSIASRMCGSFLFLFFAIDLYLLFLYVCIHVYK